MIAGRLNKKISIEHVEVFRNNITGEEERSEKQTISARADVQWSAGRREVRNLEVVYSYNVTFITWMYLYKKISEGDVIWYGGKKFLILSLEPVPEQKMLYIRADSLV